MTPTGSSGRIEMLNGVPIYFELHGSGEPLLPLHGFSGCSQDWSAFTAMQAQSIGGEFQLIIPDMRGHGRSFAREDGIPETEGAQPGLAVPLEFSPWRHDQAAADMFALLDHLGIETFKGLGISGGGNVLLHMATKQPERVKAMVLVSATSYFPAQARPIMRAYPDNLPAAERENLRRRHPGGDAQIEAILASTKASADSYDDMNFTPSYLGRITARTLIVQGDRDPPLPGGDFGGDGEGDSAIESMDCAECRARACPGATVAGISENGGGVSARIRDRMRRVIECPAAV